MAVSIPFVKFVVRLGKWLDGSFCGERFLYGSIKGPFCFHLLPTRNMDGSERRKRSA